MSVKLTEQEGLRQIGNGQPASPINEGRFQGSVGVDWQRVESQVLQVQELTWRSWSTALEDTSFQRWFADWLSAIQQSGLQWRKKGGPKFTELIQLLISNEEREIGAEEVEAMVKALPLRWIEHVEVMQKIDRHGTDSAPRCENSSHESTRFQSEVILEVLSLRGENQSQILQPAPFRFVVAGGSGQPGILCHSHGLSLLGPEAWAVSNGATPLDHPGNGG